jgi:hypothetical protein
MTSMNKYVERRMQRAGIARRPPSSTARADGAMATEEAKRQHLLTVVRRARNMVEVERDLEHRRIVDEEAELLRQMDQ